MMDLDLNTIVRALVAGLSLMAAYSLWDARQERGNTWEQKMKDIWLCHMLFVTAEILRNVQLMYADDAVITWGLLITVFALLGTIKGTYSGKFYTKDQPR